jgi:methylated-DNA-[protein]-cysteine S-methyltransferase
MKSTAIRHTLFRTPWGHFGLVFNAETLCRTLLPVPDRDKARAALLDDRHLTDLDVPFEKDLARDLQRRIIAYFEGEDPDFSTDPAVDLADRSPFARRVLAACRRIPLGQTRTYAQLAAKTGRARAARAVGTAMAHNPVPLIVPCHRVVRTDGGLGGFSAAGGTKTKQRLMRHEQAFSS